MIKIIFHEDISLYTVECDNEKVYECLSQDEVLEVVKQEMHEH